MTIEQGLMQLNDIDRNVSNEEERNYRLFHKFCKICNELTKDEFDNFKEIVLDRFDYHRYKCFVNYVAFVDYGLKFEKTKRRKKSKEIN